MDKRTCTMSGCDRPHVARDLCAMHWKRKHGKRTKYPIVCQTCGADYLSNRADGKFCSDQCKGARYSKTMRRSCDLPTDHPVMVLMREAERRRAVDRETAKGVKRREWSTARECPGCASMFCPLYTPRMVTCSRRCMKRVERRKRRLSDRRIGWVWSEFMRIAAKFDYRCAYCGVKPERLDPDHVVPLARGGADSTTNLLPACSSCNSSKSAMLLVEWTEWRVQRRLPPRITTWATTDSRYTHLTHALLAA